VLLLLTELYRTPDLPKHERMMTIIDHVFGHCYGVGVRERCSDLLGTVKDNLEAFYTMKGVDKRKNGNGGTPQVQRSNRQQQLQYQQHMQQQQRQQHSLPPLQATNMSDMGQMGLHAQLVQTPMDNLNVDLDALLSASGGNIGGPTSTTETFEDFFAGMGNNEPGAIFVPVDPATTTNDWMDGVGGNVVDVDGNGSVGLGSENSLGGGNGMRQWVSGTFWTP